MKITIKYDGAYPCLCMGRLFVIIDGVEWDFGEYCLDSGGNVSFDEDWTERVTTGPWSISRWPENFPGNLKEKVLDAVNDNISYGCCGGCV